MKIIIDPYRGGQDTGQNINNKYEKNLLLELSKYMSEEFNKQGIDTELVRTNDVQLSDDERNSIINEIKNNNDLIIQNRISEGNEFDIIYPLRNTDKLPSMISSNLESNNINVNKYYQRRLPTNTILDYYNIIRNTSPNETIIIEYPPSENYKLTVDIIVDTIVESLNGQKKYTVAKGDTLYQIAKKYNTTVAEIKKLNNLSSNNLTPGQILKTPSPPKETLSTSNYYTYTIKKGDTLYQIAKKYNTTPEAIKTSNNLTSNTLTIGATIKIPKANSETSSTLPPSNANSDIYIVKKGDTLYQIAQKYNTTVAELKKNNNLTNNNLTIGQVLNIPAPVKEYFIYTVKKGDTLYQIAQKYNTTVAEIKKLNNFTTNNLSLDQNLKIPR